MANALFTAYRNVVLGSGTYAVPDLNTDALSAFFVDHADDTPVPGTDVYVNPGIAGAAQEPAFASAPSLTTPTIGVVAAGVFDADDPVFTALTGDQVESLVLFKDTGTDTTSPLLAYWDTATGLPLTPNGGNVTVVWAAGGIITF